MVDLPKTRESKTARDTECHLKAIQPSLKTLRALWHCASLGFIDSDWHSYHLRFLWKRLASRKTFAA